MEPFDPFRNEGSSGHFKHRISSILKAPRKSEKQEHVVECAEPVDKRKSRRVSFAPADDVLLFMEDAKNTTSARSPLQDLITPTAADTQNRVQFAVTENGIQQITGMETLLKAPLHTSQQRDMVNSNAGVDIGEKTVMFSSEDALMDMTHCHTINIASDAEVLDDIFSKNTYLKAEKKSTASSVLPLDPGFESFLASLSQPSSSSTNPTVPRTSLPAGVSSGVTNNCLSQLKTQQADVDKENLAPSFVPDVFEKTMNTSSSLYPENDVSMDMTEAQTGRIQAFTADESDPFQCLLPSKEMYSQRDGKVSQTAEKNKQQQSKKTPLSYSCKDMKSLQKSSLRASLPGHQIKADKKDELTIRFTAGDNFMDMTHSHTVIISSGLCPLSNKPSLPTGREIDNFPSQRRKTESSSKNSVDLGFKDFLAGFSNSNSSGNAFQGDAVRPEKDANMCMTRAGTGVPGSDDPFQFPFQNGDSVRRAEMPPGQKNREDQGSLKHAGQGTPFKSSLKTKVQKNQVKFDSDQGERTVRFSADDECMDETRSHTVNIVSDFQSKQNLECVPAFGKKTDMFSANDVGMDMTQSHTVNIAAMDETRSHAVNIATNFEPRRQENMGFVPSCGEKTMRKFADDAAMDSEGDQGERTVRFSADDECMDETRSHTVNIVSDFQSKQNLECVPALGEKTVMFSANDVGMDMTQSHTVNIAAMDETRSRAVNIATNFEPRRQENMGFVPSCGEKTMRKFADDAAMDSEGDQRERTVRFSADDECMDETRSHTVNIVSDFQSKQNLECVPALGEKTVMFSANDVGMDMTQSHTVNIAAMDETRSRAVNIATNFEPRRQENMGFVPSCGEKTMRKFADDAAMDSEGDQRERTVRFSAVDACMDITRSLNINIAANVEPKSHQRTDVLPPREEVTLRFSANDAAMDVTTSHTVNIATSFEPQPHQAADILPTCGENTLRFSENDAAMDETQCLTVNIASNSMPDSGFFHQGSNTLSTPDKDFSFSEKKMEMEPHHQRRTKSYLAHSLNLGLSKSPPRKSVSSAYSGIAKASLQEAGDSNGFQDQPTQSNDLEIKTSDFVLAEKLVDRTMTEDVTMDITEAQTGKILRQTCTDEYPQGLTSTQDVNPSSDHFGRTERTSQNQEAASISDGDKITNRPESLDSNEIDTWKEAEPRLETLSSSQKPESSPAAVNHDVDAAPSRKSRRMSLADLHSKVRRLSQMINTAPDTAAIDGYMVPHMDTTSPKDKTKTLPVMEPELETSLTNPNENTQAQNQIQDQESSNAITTTPFNLKTKQLISRLSVSSIKAKLPQRTRPEDQKKVNSTGEHTRAMPLNVSIQLNNFDADVSDINDEELGSLEDVSETVDTGTPRKTSRPLGPSEKIRMEELLEDEFFEQDFMSALCGRKRPLLEEENSVEEDEKRMRGSNEVDEVSLSQGKFAAECEGSFTAPVTSTQSTDNYNNSHTSSRCEATFVSTFKHSLFESQLKEYASDVQSKFDDGTITVLEFFKLFSIHCVIHTSRQSVHPVRPIPDSDRKWMDSQIDRHIIRPKQMVYESDVLNLTEKVEGLKGRMQDLDRPLRIFNRALWEDMRNSSEIELKSFGAKLKERNNFFSKTSKAQSHEMKEALYLQLVQANLEEQKKLVGRIEEGDEMIKSLDECIHESETELAAVEEKGSEDRPSLKSCQEELQKVTEAMADTDRQTSELEMQKTQNSNKITRLISETRNLESHITLLNMMNEWRFGEKTDDCTVYTFLYDTFHLQLDYEKSTGCEAESQSERKISDIKFRLHLNAVKSEDHACLVHKLLSQYVDGETSWVKKYSTSRHIPKLLHDVSLVVSRCRLLGEELRLLKLWGSVKLNILNISCEGTRVLFVFSSLKTLSKFEVLFSVSLTNQLCYVLQVQSFRNMIGSTGIEQIEEIVASFSPSKNLLTKIVKKINEKLLL